MKDLQLKNIEIEMSSLGRQLRERGIPSIIIFFGWSASGRGTLISRLINIFDARSYNVVTKSVISELSPERVPFQKFWLNIPEKGRIVIFERSPYDELLAKFADEDDFDKKDINYILSFERTLRDEGYLILKIFLDVSKKEQKKRLKKLESDKNTAWRVSKKDWKQNEDYDEYKKFFDKIIEKTSVDYSKWEVIDANDLKEAKTKLFTLIKDFFAESLKAKNQLAKFTNINLSKVSDSILDKVDLSFKVERDEYEEKIDSLQERLFELEFKLYRKRLPLIIVFEGVDAAGKGGAIKRLTQGLDPRGFEVVPIAAPDGLEKKHHYLWRFWRKFPKPGHITIFDRSWYGRVLVERVEGFCSENDWKRAYQEINEMEGYLFRHGTIILKFWLHISQEEQLRRFHERQNTEWKRWKITEEDWRNREKWDKYKIAIDETLLRTNTPYAPWIVVESECKLYARIKVLSSVVACLEKEL